MADPTEALQKIIGTLVLQLAQMVAERDALAAELAALKLPPEKP